MAEIEHGGFFRQKEQMAVKAAQQAKIDAASRISPTEVEDGKAVIADEPPQEQSPPEQKPTEPA